MIRKFVLAVAAIAALGTASLAASTPAAAWGKGGPSSSPRPSASTAAGYRVYVGLRLRLLPAHTAGS